MVVSEVLQESRSAKLPHNRPEFTRLMQDIEAGRIRGILTWSINRLSRNALDGGQVAHYLQTGKLDFIRTVERTYRPDDNALLMSIENGMAIAYIQDLSRNVLRGMRGKAERGWCPYKAPLGYRNDAESREIHVDTERWNLVRRGWDMALDGSTIKDVHAFLRSRGLTIRCRSGRQTLVSRSVVYGVFTNPFYMGQVKFKGEFYKGAHQPMVTPDEFELARQLLSRPYLRRKGANRLFTFSGLLRCASCGAAVVGEEKRKCLSSGGFRTYIYYHCSGSRGCARRSIREEVLAEQMATHVKAIAIPSSFAGWLKDAMLSISEALLPERALSASGLQAEERRLEARLKRLTDLRLDGEISSSEFANGREEILRLQDTARETRHKELSREAAMLQALKPRLQAAVAAGELSGNPSCPRLLAKILRKGGQCLLSEGGSSFVPDPILAKIASLEPLRDGSEKPKQGDFVHPNSVWWTFAHDLRTALYGLSELESSICAGNASVKGPLHQMVGTGGASERDSFSWR